MINKCIDCGKRTKGYGQRCYSCSRKGEKHWNYRKHLSKKIKEKIRKGNKGKKRLEKTKRKMKGNKNALGHINSKRTKQKMREKALQRIQTHSGPYKDTKPEIAMQNILKELHIPYEKQFRVGNHLADFHFLNTNILAEVDGDYYHSNPKKFSKLNEMQIKNKQRDIRNDQIAKENGYILLRFWESDILKNKEKIIQKLKKFYE